MVKRHGFLGFFAHLFVAMFFVFGASVDGAHATDGVNLRTIKDWYTELAEGGLHESPDNATYYFGLDDGPISCPYDNYCGISSIESADGTIQALYNEVGKKAFFKTYKPQTIGEDELKAKLAEMYANVESGDTIVTDILNYTYGVGHFRCPAGTRTIDQWEGGDNQGCQCYYGNCTGAAPSRDENSIRNWSATVNGNQLELSRNGWLGDTSDSYSGPDTTFNPGIFTGKQEVETYTWTDWLEKLNTLLASGDIGGEYIYLAALAPGAGDQFLTSEQFNQIKTCKGSDDRVYGGIGGKCQRLYAFAPNGLPYVYDLESARNGELVRKDISRTSNGDGSVYDVEDLDNLAIGCSMYFPSGGDAPQPTCYYLGFDGDVAVPLSRYDTSHIVDVLTVLSTANTEQNLAGWTTVAAKFDGAWPLTLAFNGDAEGPDAFSGGEEYNGEDSGGGTGGGGSTPPSYTCSAGTYLPKNSTECSQCLTGHYCTGGTWTGTSGNDRGLTYCGEGYRSNAGAASADACTLIPYTITYNLDGGTNAAANPAKYTVATSTITLADPTKTGYTFGGWYSEAAFTNKVTQIAKGSTGDKTLYAKWTANGVACAAGKYLPKNSNTCATCPAGNYCPGGTYTSSTNDQGADACPTGYHTDKEGEVSSVDSAAGLIEYGFAPDVTGISTPDECTVDAAYSNATGSWIERRKFDSVVDLLYNTMVGTYYFESMAGYYLSGVNTKCMSAFGAGPSDGVVYNSIKKCDAGYYCPAVASASENNATVCGGTNNPATLGRTQCPTGTTSAAGASSASACSIPQTYKVTLDKQSGTGGTSEYYYQYNTKGTCYYYASSALSTCTDSSDGQNITVPTRTGYTFGGYWTGKNGTGTQYVNASGLAINNLYKTTGDRTLYANWVNQTITCAAGKYLPQGKTECATCEWGYCTGGTFEYSDTKAQGITYCPEDTRTVDDLDEKYQAIEIFNYAAYTTAKGATTPDTCVSVLDLNSSKGNDSKLYEISKYNAKTKKYDTVQTYGFYAVYGDGYFSGSKVCWIDPEDIGLIMGGFEIPGFTEVKECPAGSYCPYNIETFSEYESCADTPSASEMEALMKKTCPIGSYSAAGAGTCTVCGTAKTTATAGATSADACITCDGVRAEKTEQFFEVFTPLQPNWNSSKARVDRLCWSFQGCLPGYWYQGKTSTNSDEWPSSADVSNAPVGTCSIITYKYTYSAGGGVLANGNPTEWTVKTTPVTIKNPTRTGYTFAGWQTELPDNQFVTVTDEIIVPTNVKDVFGGLYDLKLVAQWTPNTYTITLDANGGTGGASSATATYDAAMDTLTSLPTRAGYTFHGYTDAQTGGTLYYNADGTAARKWDKVANTTLYAQWSIETYTITYNLNGGTNPAGAPSSYTVETATFDLPTPTRTSTSDTDYGFLGWYENSGLTGNKVTQITRGTTGNKTYWAKWTEIKRQESTSVTCAAGTYIAAGATTCTECTAGYACAGGSYTIPKAGATSDTGRTQCTGATYAGAGASTCTSCPSPYTYDTSAGKTKAEQCTLETSGGHCVTTVGGDGGANCPYGYYCPGAIVVPYGSTGGTVACPDAIQNKPSKWPDNYHDVTKVALDSSWGASGHSGSTIDHCSVAYDLENSRGTIFALHRYNSKTGKYDIQVQDGFWMWYKSLKSGYYLGKKWTYNGQDGCQVNGNGESKLYQDALPCPTDAYCPGYDGTIESSGWPKCGDGVYAAETGYCPAIASHTVDTWSAMYRNPTIVETKFFLDGGAADGSTFLDTGGETGPCMAEYLLQNDAGTILAMWPYSVQTGKYEFYFDDAETLNFYKDYYTFYVSLNPGYYFTKRWSRTLKDETITMCDHAEAGYPRFYVEAEPCPAGSYCPGIPDSLADSISGLDTGNIPDSWPKCGDDTEYTDVYNKYACPTPYPNSAAKSSKIEQCYLTTTAGKYVATARADQVQCLANNYCAGGTQVNYGSTGGMQSCATGYESAAGASSCSAITYSITYNLNGGTNASSNPTKYTIETATITLAAPTKTGYTFGGWYSDAAFTTRVTQIVNGSTGDKTLWAKWTIDTYHINYVLNNGTNDPRNPTTFTGTDATLHIYPATRTGYAMDGWNSVAIGELFAPDVDIENPYMDFDLQAQWTANTYTITLDVNGGTGGLASVTVIYDAALPTLTKLPTKANWIFQGYYDAATGGVQYYDASGHPTSTAKWNKTNGMTLYAHYAQDIVSCARGQYYNGTSMVQCPAGMYCPGTGSVDAGVAGCGTQCPTSHANSATGAASANECFVSCTEYSLVGGTAIPTSPRANYPMACTFNGVSDTGNPCDIVDGQCKETSCKGDYEMISGRCTPCDREHALSYKTTGNCVVASCESGFHPDGRQCVENAMECDAPNAVSAVREWDSRTNSFTICRITECESGFHIMSNACISDIQPCTLENGNGTKEWNHSTSAYGECVASECAPGYTNDPYDSHNPGVQCGECKNKYDAAGNQVASTYVRGCEIASCVYQGEKYALDGGECVSICDDHSDETGSMKWNGKKCIRTCNDGYMPW